MLQRVTKTESAIIIINFQKHRQYMGVHPYLDLEWSLYDMVQHHLSNVEQCTAIPVLRLFLQAAYLLDPLSKVSLQTCVVD